MNLKVWPQRSIQQNSNFPILFLEFLCWNYLQQGEFFAQNGPWVFSHLALSFLKTHKKMPALTAAQFKWNPISNRYLKAEGSWGASLCDNQLCKMDKERVATSKWNITVYSQLVSTLISQSSIQLPMNLRVNIASGNMCYDSS